MHKFAILLKTYIDDIGYAKRLILSYKKHNKDNIPLYIVAPQSEIKSFDVFSGDGIELYSDEEITHELAIKEVRGIRPGYINQEIIKLAFWEKKLCENYLCVDSDGVFIRDFYISDFMYDQDTPYTILVEDNELMVEPEYFTTHWEARYKSIRRIKELVGLKGSRILTSHGFSILSGKVLKSFKVNFLQKKRYTYKDILAESPYEFSWYNMWLQQDKTIDLYIREPLFKCFHHKNQHMEYLIRGIHQADIARGYLGVVVNSNYSRGFGVISFDEDKHKVLSLYLSKVDIYKILINKLGMYFLRVSNKFKDIMG